tara:strand:- start:251 stop:607 length:357 start_codon:yes stop_codon:yes gene_type:complete
MGTSSTISIKSKTTKRTIYCNFDGYLKHNGRILLNYYTDINDINAMINHGDISLLDVNLDKTIFYSRDMDDMGCSARTYDSDDYGEREDYNYMYVVEEGKWYYNNLNDWTELTLKEIG